MKTLRLLPMLAVACAWSGTGCALDERAAGEQSGEIGTAVLSLSDHSRSASKLKVKAKEVGTGKVAGEWSAKLGEAPAMELPLLPGTYLVDMQAFADEGAQELLCGRTVRVKIVARVKLKIHVKIFIDTRGVHGLDVSGPDVEGGDENTCCVPPVGGSGGGDASGGNAGGVTAGGASGSAGAGGSGGSDPGAGGGSGASGGSGGSDPGGSGGSGGSDPGGSGGSGGQAAGSGGASAGGSNGGGGQGGSAAEPDAGGEDPQGGSGGGDPGGSGGAPGGGDNGGSCPPKKPCGGDDPEDPPSVPVIHGVDVDVGDIVAKVKVKATATLGGALQFIWSGCGFGAPTAGGDGAEIDVKAILASHNKETTILVQSKDGVVAQVKVKFKVKTGVLGSLLGLADTATTSVLSLASLNMSAKECVDTHARCTGTCKAKAKATTGGAEVRGACMLDCGIGMSTCCLSK